MQGIELEAIIIEELGQSGDYFRFLVADKSGSMVLTLFGDKGKSFHVMQIIHISGAYSRLYKNSIQLYLKRDGGRIIRKGLFIKEFSNKINISDYEWVMLQQGKESKWIALNPGEIDKMKEEIANPHGVPEATLSPLLSPVLEAPQAQPNANAAVEQLKTVQQILDSLQNYKDVPEVMKIKDSLIPELEAFMKNPAPQLPPNIVAILVRLAEILQTVSSAPSPFIVPPPAPERIPTMPAMPQQQQQRPFYIPPVPGNNQPVQQLFRPMMPTNPQAFRPLQQNIGTNFQRPVPFGVLFGNTGTSSFNLNQLVLQQQQQQQQQLKQQQQQFMQNIPMRPVMPQNVPFMNFFPTIQTVPQQQQQQKNKFPDNASDASQKRKKTKRKQKQEASSIMPAINEGQLDAQNKRKLSYEDFDIPKGDEEGEI